MKLRRLAGVVSAAIALSLGTAVSVSAHAPTIGSSKYLADATILFYWASAPAAPPSWLKTATDLAAGTDWPSSFNVHANTPRFQKDSANPVGVIEYQARANSSCDPGFVWDACTDYYNTSGTTDMNGKWKRTVFNADSLWCQTQGPNPPWTGSCRDVRRVLMHEWGHAVGLSRRLDPPVGDKHSGESESFTVMRLLTPVNPNSGYATHALQECDVIRLRMLYGSNAASSPFLDCTDHIPNEVNSNGLKTTTSVTSGASYGACLGTGVTVSGAFRLLATSNYGALSGNYLSNRTVHIDRKLPSTATWTEKITSTTTGPTAPNWSRSFTSTVSVTYQYRAKFYEATESYVGESTSSAFTITWSNPC